jgi:hypothetical protein
MNMNIPYDASLFTSMYFYFKHLFVIAGFDTEILITELFWYWVHA